VTIEKLRLHGVKLVMVDVEETNVGAHALLATSEGKIILQQRDNNPGIVNPGLISIFGGTIKAKDNLEQGLRRELLEELELNIDDLSVKKLGTFLKTQEMDGLDWVIDVYVVNNVKPESLKIHEGKGMVCDYPKELLKLDKLTRITRLVLQSYIDSQNKF
jgi:8-oxo-dGTP pyrophosphatase MutT (NUDIX family)